MYLSRLLCPTTFFVRFIMQIRYSSCNMIMSESNFHLMEKPTGKENICMLPSMGRNLRPCDTGSVHDPKRCGHLENPAYPRVAVPVYSLGSVVHVYLPSTAAPLCQQNWQEGERL
ncbi:protein Red [Platysternon megacephalum]|uniref:Protein Red n=1 Tax=Platysternon megacephalum TaxID=55544 RepID=A0A4D9F2J0_9SAUR|nr:protein Red [Platysternon megacephalum]